MDAFNSNFNNSDSGYKTNDVTETRPKMPTPGSFLGFFRAAQPQPAPVSNASATPETTLTAPANGYHEPVPVYRGQYEKLYPLTFNTMPVDDASNSRLERAKLARYDRAQLFFLLRLERFLRLRHYWMEASPRSDESWKTDLALRSIYSAFRDCQKHGVGDDAQKLLKEWGCC
jgi:hypothetical protein